MDFLKITSQFEDQIKKDFAFELLELHYEPHAFGSGTKAYRINGKNIKIVFDGRDGQVQVAISGLHENYGSSKWKLIFDKPATTFTDSDMEKLKSKIME